MPDFAQAPAGKKLIEHEKLVNRPRCVPPKIQ
jgi:hypothetical protein